MMLSLTNNIVSHTDTGEYLSKCEYFSPDKPAWSKDIYESFCFRSYSDTESNGKADIRQFKCLSELEIWIKMCGTGLKSLSYSINSY